MQLRQFGEFGLIDLIRQRFEILIPPGWDGIGDDCAVIPWNDRESLLVTTDMLIEETHFLRDKIKPYQLGYKSLAVNLSDIAGMGGGPLATFLSVGLPESVGVAWCEQFLEGYGAFGVPLLGGDTTVSKEGIAINITVLGLSENQCIKRRKDARAGDLIAVTGLLGDSAGGLKCMLEGIDNEYLINSHLMPRPHLQEGEWLGRQSGVHAMMDVSDGIAGDLRHMLNASGVSAVIDTGKLPVSSELRRMAHETGWDTLALATGGGEDYTLLFTFDPNKAETIEKQGFHVIGKITAGEPGTIDWGNGGDFTGYRHF